MNAQSNSAPDLDSPGDVLRRNLDRLGITQEDLADALAVSRLSVNQIVNGRRAITAEMAIRLARVLDMTPEFWLDLQRRLDLQEAERAVGAEVEKLKPLRKAQRPLPKKS